MAKFHYYLKNALAEGETAIYLSIQSNGRRLKYYTGQSIEPRFWNTKQQKAVKVAHAPEFNTVLNTLQTAAETAANRLKAELKNEPTPEQIRAELEMVFNVAKPQPKTKDFISFFEHVAEQTKIRTNATTGKPLSPTRCKSLKQTIGVIKNFQTKTRFKLDFETIDRDFYDSFKTHMEKELLLSANTVGKHIKHIKTVLNEATELGLNTNLRYKSKHFRVISEAANNIYLNESELRELQRLDLSKINRLAKIRDLFLIGAWTGLRFSDFTRLNSATITKDNEGNSYFNITTQKTDTEIDIPIFPEIIPILDLYGGAETLSLPKGISNQKMNEYLKEIGQMVNTLCVPFSKDRTKAGMKISTNKMKWEYLSTHTARRSFATNMFERQPGEVSLIMAITGHKTENEFYKYIHMKPMGKASLFRQKFFKSNLKIAQ